MLTSTRSFARRASENLAMGSLIAASRGLIAATKVQRALDVVDRAAVAIRWTSPFRAADDTLPRAQALAYRWSSIVPGSSCLHRALATRIFLAGYRVDSTVVLGFRKRDGLEGHAWLEIPVAGAVTLMFVSDDDGYEVALES